MQRWKDRDCDRPTGTWNKDKVTGTEVPGQKDREGQQHTDRNKDKNKEPGIRDKNMDRVRTGSIGLDK